MSRRLVKQISECVGDSFSRDDYLGHEGANLMNDLIPYNVTALLRGVKRRPN
jgi:hypothetical protein